MRAGKAISAGLSQIARTPAAERARLLRQFRLEDSTFRALYRRVRFARVMAFAAGLLLAGAVMLLVHGGSPTVVASLILAGLAGFGIVCIGLIDCRFDLLLALLGAHKVEELHGELVTEELYGDEFLEQVEHLEPAPVARHSSVA